MPSAEGESGISRSNSAAALGAGAIIIEGWLQKESRWLRQWNWRYVTLSEEGMFRTYTKQPVKTFQDHSASLSFTVVVEDPTKETDQDACAMTDDIDIRGGCCWPVGSGQPSRKAGVKFQLAVGRRTLMFSTESEVLRKQWIQALNQAMSYQSMSASQLEPEVDPMPMDSPSKRTQPPSPATFECDDKEPAYTGPALPAAVPPPLPKAAAPEKNVSTEPPKADAAPAPTASAPGQAPEPDDELRSWCSDHSAEIKLSEATAAAAVPVPVPKAAAPVVEQPAAPAPPTPRTRLSSRVVHMPSMTGGGPLPPALPLPMPASKASSPEKEPIAPPTRATKEAAPASSAEPAPLTPATVSPVPAPAPEADAKAAPVTPPPAGKGPPPKGAGKGPPGKGPGKPPPKGKGAGGAKGKGGGAKDKAVNLPIGRRLTLKTTKTSAEAFRGLVDDGEEGDAAIEVEAPVTEGYSARPSISTARRHSVNLAAVDLAALRDAFAPQARQPRRSRAAVPLNKIELLPRDAAQNLAIVLAKMRIDTQKLATALAHLEPGSCELNAEGATRLLEVWPVQETLEPIQGYATSGKELSNLRDVERQLVPLVMVARMGPRLRLITLAGTVDERVSEALEQLQKLQDACKELQSSTVLRDLLAVVLVLFNYVNFGTEAGASQSFRGVDVQSLLRLRETKAYKGDFPNFNMLHFVLKQLLMQRTDLQVEHLDEEMGTLPLAAGMSLERLRTDLGQLRNDHQFVRSEIRDFRPAYEEPSADMLAPPDAGCDEPTTPPANCGSPKKERPEGEGGGAAGDPVTPLKGKSGATGEAVTPAKGPRSTDKARGTPGTADTRQSRSMQDTPRGRVRRGLVEMLLGMGLDSSAFAEAWLNSDAVVSCSRMESRAGTFGFECVSSEDGSPPPPGWLFLHRPSGRWQRCWCELRASVLVLYKVKGRRCVGTVYVVIAAADVVSLQSADASEIGRELALATPHGFEICSEGGRTVRLCAGGASDAAKWLSLLVSQSSRPGAGFLTVSGGQSQPSRRLYCHIHKGKLLGFARARDGIEGTAPDQMWAVTEMAHRALQSAGGASPSAKRALAGAQFGFELHDANAGSSVRFECTTYAEERSWSQELLRLSCVERRRLEAAGMTPRTSAKLQHTIHDIALESPLHRRDLFDLRAVPPETFAETPRFSRCASLPEEPVGFGSARTSVVTDGGGATVPGSPRDSVGQRLKDVRRELETRLPDGADSSSAASSASAAAIGAAPPNTARNSAMDNPMAVVADKIGATPALPEAHAQVEAKVPVTVPKLNLGGQVDQANEAEASVEKPVPWSDDSFDSEDDETDEEAVSPSVGSRSPSRRADSGIKRLEGIERRLNDKILMWQRELEMTEDDCRNLLMFFGLEAPNGPRLSVVATQLLEALHEFVRQLRTAWNDLDKFERSADGT